MSLLAKILYWVSIAGALIKKILIDIFKPSPDLRYKYTNKGFYFDNEMDSGRIFSIKLKEQYNLCIYCDNYLFDLVKEWKDSNNIYAGLPVYAYGNVSIRITDIYDDDDDHEYNFENCFIDYSFLKPYLA